MPRAVLVAFALVSGACAHAKPSPPEQRSPEGEVYSALIDSCYRTSPRDGVSGTPEVLVEERAGRLDIAGTIVSVRSGLPDSIRAVLEGAQVSAKDSSRIQTFATRQHLRILPDSMIRRFFAAPVRDTLGWNGFRRAYPLGGGIITLSHVAFSRDRQWAILQAGQQSDWLAGAGFIYVLHKEDGRWRVVYQHMTWIS